ncbi:MAG: hypothetical protein JNK82_12025 [Myxococcaceae bacterium]|nr:hypothetical protein [Myxococcaceae bacterium]
MLVVRRTSVTPDEARGFAEAAAAVLERAGVAVEKPVDSLRRLKALGVDDPAACSGRKACVLELAKQLEVGALVAISAAALQGERSVVLEAWRTADSTSLAKDAAVLKAGAPLEQLTAVSAALAAAFPAKRVDAPVARVEPVPPPTLAPAPAPVEPAKPVVVEAPSPAPERSHVITYVAAGLAAVAAGTAIALGVSAAEARARVRRGEPTSDLTGSQAQALVNQHNTLAPVAVGLGAATAAFGVIAVVTW